MLKTVQLSVTQAVVQAYAELTDDFNPLHVDPAFAATTPMGRPIAHGTMSLCLIWQCLQRNFGADVFTGLDLAVRFVRPVYIGDEVIAGGEPEPGHPGHYKVWVRGLDGNDRIVGTAVLGTAPST